jgi:hypothetical protein
MSNKLPQNPQQKLDAYSQLCVDSLITRLRVEGGFVYLNRHTLSELRDAGMSASDLKKAINLAAKLELVTCSVRGDGVPIITLVKKEVLCEQ